MADTISTLPDAGSLIGNELIPIVQDGFNVKTTPNALLTGINALLNNKGNKVVTSKDVILLVAGWTLVNGFWEYDLVSQYILPNSIVLIQPNKYSTNIVINARICQETTDITSGLKLYADNQPSGDIFVTLTIF